MAARTPDDCDRLFVVHVNAGDLDALMALYETTCSLVRQDRTVAVGHAAIRDTLGRLIAMRARITADVVRVVTAGEDLAMVYNDWAMTATGPDGRPVEASGKAIEVVRRRPDGTWRFVLDDPFARG